VHNIFSSYFIAVGVAAVRRWFNQWCFSHRQWNWIAVSKHTHYQRTEKRYFNTLSLLTLNQQQASI